MAKSCTSNMWVWKEPDPRWSKNVLTHIKNSEPKEKDLVVLHCIDVDGFDESIPLASYVLNLCKTFKVFESERLMFLSPKDLFLAIELCLGRQKRGTDISDIEISDDDIIQCHKSYIEQFQSSGDGASNKAVKQLKKFIHENNCADLWLLKDHLSKHMVDNTDVSEHLSNLKFLVLGSFPDGILVDIIRLIGSNSSVLNVTVEMDLDISLQGSPSMFNSSQGVEVSSEPLQIQDMVPVSDEELLLKSATEEYVEETISAFLSLLVNSRSELALSKVMTSPIIDLSHEAFTKLKHLAEEKEMPMCQTAISYVTRIKLGGKGYAPPSDCPMLPHFKGLELFVDVLNQMQTLIEEDLEPLSAVKRLINILKKKLTKCGSDKLKPASIETASENLKTVANKVVRIMKSKGSCRATPLVCQESLDVLHSFLNYVSCSCSTFSPQKILREKHSKRTPINLPPLLGYFRSPEDETSCEASEINEDSILSEKSNLVVQKPISYFHHSDQSSSSVMCLESQTPSKVSFKGCLDENSNDVPVAKVKKGRKRSIFGELSNAVPDAENKPEAKKSKTLEKKKAASKLKDVTNKTTVKKENYFDAENKPEAKKSKTLEKKIAAPKLKDVTNKTTVKKEVNPKPKGGSKKFKLIEGQGKITTFFKSN